MASYQETKRSILGLQARLDRRDAIIQSGESASRKLRAAKDMNFIQSQLDEETKFLRGYSVVEFVTNRWIPEANVVTRGKQGFRVQVTGGNPDQEPWN